MKTKVAIFFLLVLIAGAWLSVASPVVVNPAEDRTDTESKTFLLLGIDRAAGNSDVVALARYIEPERRIILLQLPRDLYIETGDAHPKLNHIFAACLASGMTKKHALQKTAAYISDAFSIPIDGAMCLDLAVFASLVDAVGGIPITIPFDMTYRDPEQGLSILLKKGKTVLDGSAAEQFVRYRSGYVEGDLGRLDAQKLFFAAAFAHAKQHVSVADAISLAIRFWDDIDMIGNKKEVLAFLTTLWKERNALSVYFVSLPGEAIQEHGNTGAWYYILNRGATCNLLNRFFVPREHLHADTFDKNGVFYKDNEQILNIYFSDGMTYHVYAAEEISDINILKKD